MPIGMVPHLHPVYLSMEELPRVLDLDNLSPPVRRSEAGIERGPPPVYYWSVDQPLGPVQGSSGPRGVQEHNEPKERKSAIL